MNDQFAAPVGRPARPAPQIAFPSNGGFQPAPTFQQAMGNVCYSQAGAFPGPFNPIGMPCTVMTPWGPVPGQVGR
jgi:hypothetical protein